jgi:hypothetical protein
MEMGKKNKMKMGERVLRSDEQVSQKDFNYISEELIIAEKSIQILSPYSEVRVRVRVRKYGADWTFKEKEEMVRKYRGTIKTLMRAANKKAQNRDRVNFGSGEKEPA